MELGTCPVCNGISRVPVPQNSQRYKTLVAGYDKETDTFPCRNCGGQYQWGNPTGKVKLSADAKEPCMHEYSVNNLGRCFNGYTCKHCGDYYTIDSGD
jgi:hypothetical protein